MKGVNPWQVAEDQRLIQDYVYAAATAVLLYDYLVMLSGEIETIWRNKISYTTVVFFFARYSPLANVYFVLKHQTSLDLSSEACYSSYLTAVWLAIVAIGTSEIILSIRVWAIWNRSTTVGVLLIIVLLTNMIISSVETNKYMQRLEVHPPPYPGFRGCIVSSRGNLYYVNFVELIVYYVTVLSLMCISAFRAYQMGHMSKLLNIIHRDGILFYFYLLLFAIANTILLTKSANRFGLLMVPLHSNFNSLFAARIVIDIRTVGRNGFLTSQTVATELHIAYDEELRFASSTIRETQADFELTRHSVFESHLPHLDQDIP